MIKELKLAGVTFANEDGENRQDILRNFATSMCGGIITTDLMDTIYHNPETDEDEYAIKVVEHNSRKIIGWIPKSELANPDLDEQMTGFIRHYKNNYYVVLDTIKKPSQKQYHYAKSLAKRLGIPAIAYDSRAYAYVFNMNRNENVV
jgi:hypothetical protein